MFEDRVIKMFSDYEDIITTGLDYDYSTKEITDAIYQKEFNKYIRKGISPRVEELGYVEGFVEVLKNSQIQKYKWKTGKYDSCQRCRELNGRVFNHKPDRERLAHPNCKCEIEEIDGEDAEILIGEHEKEVEKRERVINNLNEATKFDDKGNPKPADKSIGKCAAYVSNALEEGGIDIRGIRDEKYNQLKDNTYAYQYGNYLVDEEAGFLKIGSGGNSKNPKNYKPQSGDIAVFEPLQDGHAGHIQMFNGDYWVSDFEQINNQDVANMGTGFWAGPKYRDIQPHYTIYRNSNWQDW